MNFAFILLACGTAFADPPSTNLVSVQLTIGTETLKGYSEYWDVDQMEHTGTVDNAAIESFLRKRPIPLWPSNLDLVEFPNRFSYIYVGPRLYFDPSTVRKIEVRKGPRDGHVTFDYPFYQVSSRAAAKLHGRPYYQCRQNGRSVSVTWLSYNPSVGEPQLKKLCSRSPKGESQGNEFGSHPKFKDVFWFSFGTPEEDD